MSQKSVLRKPKNQSFAVNFAARASAKRNVRFIINEKEVSKHKISEHESKHSESDTESEHSDWDKNNENEMEVVDNDSSSDYVPSASDDDDNDDKMEVDNDSSSDYVPSASDDDDKMEVVDNDSSSDYVPSASDDEDDNDNEMEVDNDSSSDYAPSLADDDALADGDASEAFDEKVVNILSSLKYDTLTPSKYLFDWGSEYWSKLESTKAITRVNLSSFKRKIKSSRQWNNVVNKVKMMVEKERLE